MLKKGFIPLSKSANTFKIKEQIELSQDIQPTKENLQTFTFLFFFNSSMKDFKCKVALFETKRTIISILDSAKISDMIIAVIDINEGIDEEGKTYVSLLRAQGIPSIIFVIQGLDKVNPKKQKDVKKDMINTIEKEFANEPKVVFCDSIEDSRILCRWIHEQKVKKIHWKELRPYLLIDKWNFQPNEVFQCF